MFIALRLELQNDATFVRFWFSASNVCDVLVRTPWLNELSLLLLWRALIVDLFFKLKLTVMGKYIMEYTLAHCRDGLGQLVESVHAINIYHGDIISIRSKL